MSSSLCKNLEGAIFPLQVEAVEDGIDNAVHAFDIHKADHWPGAAPHLHEQALDNVRRRQQRTPYNEQIYLQALARRGSPLLPQLPAAVNPN